jgi:uncharacterized protein (TIGR02001 family)
MKTIKTLLATAVVASAITAPAVMAEVEVSGSAAVASTYLWRGYDLGDGTPAVSGDVAVSAGGAYGGVWVSSGDTSTGTEYDVFAGYGFEAGGVSVDLSVWNYNYPGSSEIDFGELTEVVLSLGVGAFSFGYYDNVAGGSGYEYYTLGGEFGKFSATVGMHDNPEGDDPTHLTVSYAYDDNFTLTASQFIADEDDGDDLQLVISYSLPF